MYKAFTDEEKEKILIENDQLVKKLANKYMDKNWGFEDTYQELRMLFFKMLDKYDPEKGKITTLFYRYVQSWFSGNMLQYQNAKKRIPYNFMVYTDRLSEQSSINNSNQDKDDFFNFMRSEELSPDILENNKRIEAFILKEMKTFEKPGILIGMLVHGKKIKDLIEVYNLTDPELRYIYKRNLEELKNRVEAFISGNDYEKKNY